MPKASEEISKYNANSGGKTDANLANDSLNLGGIPAENYATKKYVEDYHAEKEAIQKQYIDAQDAINLQTAKAYTDQKVASQDFSNFAKISDVQALDTKLSNQLQTQATSQKNYTDTQIQSVVNDVNENFDDVGAAIDSLNNTTNSLFTSVSNGKSKVAAAITDKGVTTASDASFDTMASNIQSIPSGGGSIDPNFVNTSDATATASDIFSGKTAYAKGNKIYGTYVEKDPNTNYPTYGTDTSGATATASDIAFGKTAWANGILLTGTAIFEQSTEVEEIYHASLNPYTIEYSLNVGMTTYPDTQDEVTDRFCMAFSKDLNYCVSAVRLNNSTTETDYAIESHTVTSSGLQIQGSYNNDSIIYKKYRYTKQELGLGENEEVQEIALGASGLLSKSNCCLLMIRTKDSLTTSGTTKYYLHFYTYHLNDNGVIGKAYEGEKYIISNYTYDYTDQLSSVESLGKFIFSNTEPLTILTFGIRSRKHIIRKITLAVTNDVSNANNVIILVNFGNREEGSWNSDYGYSTDAILSTDDKTVSLSSLGNIRKSGLLIELTEELNLAASAILSSSTKGTILPLSNTQLLSCESGSSVFGKIQFKILNKTTNLNTTQITTSTNKTIYAKYNENDLHYPVLAIITPNKDKVVVFCAEFESSHALKASSLGVAIFEVDDILNATSNSTITPTQTQLFSYSSGNSTSFFEAYLGCIMNYNATKIIFYVNSRSLTVTSKINPYLCMLSVDEDSENLLGIKYKNQFFSKVETNMLSATANDVKSGKTFIGNSGEPETGTLEV